MLRIAIEKDVQILHRYVFIVSYCIRFYHVRLLAFLVKDNIKTVFLLQCWPVPGLTSLTDQSTRIVGDKAE